MHFRITMELGNADPGIVWSILSNVRSMPKYWRIMSRFSIFRGGDSYLVEYGLGIKIPLRGGLMRIRSEGGCLVMEYLDWPLRGFARNCVGEYALISEWDVRLNILLLPFYPRIRRYIITGTREALRGIIEEALRVQGDAQRKTEVQS